jgi:hypothetical protein
VLEALQVNAVETMDEVLQIALERLPTPRSDQTLEMPAPIWQQTPAGVGAAEGPVS